MTPDRVRELVERIQHQPNARWDVCEPDCLRCAFDRALSQPQGDSHNSLEPISYEGISEMLPSVLTSGTDVCPLCGNSGVHQHTPVEIVIYRNGVKYGQRINASPASGEGADISNIGPRCVNCDVCGESYLPGTNHVCPPNAVAAPKDAVAATTSTVSTKEFGVHTVGPYAGTSCNIAGCPVCQPVAAGGAIDAPGSAWDGVRITVHDDAPTSTGEGEVETVDDVLALLREDNWYEHDFEDLLARCRAAHVRALRSPQASEAVAWRVRCRVAVKDMPAVGVWVYHEATEADIRHAFDNDAHLFDIEPLFTRTPVVDEGAILRQILADIEAGNIDSVNRCALAIERALRDASDKAGR